MNNDFDNNQLYSLQNSTDGTKDIFSSNDDQSSSPQNFQHHEMNPPHSPSQGWASSNFLNNPGGSPSDGNYYYSNSNN